MTDQKPRPYCWTGAVPSWMRPDRRALARGLRRRMRQARADLRGAVARLRYERTYGHPDLAVAPDVLADRVRSSLGPLERRLDLPHVHVMVEGRTVLLHGDVARAADAAAIVAHAADVPGVATVESHLHVGLLPSDTRPSTSRAIHPPSRARRRLEAAAIRAGADAGHAQDAVSAVLTIFVRRLPPTEARHVLGHLPTDVRVLVRRRTWLAGRPARTVEKLVWQVSVQSDHLAPAHAESVTRAVVEALRSLVPEEGRGVAQVLPDDLRSLWAGGEEAGATAATEASASAPSRSFQDAPTGAQR